MGCDMDLRLDPTMIFIVTLHRADTESALVIFYKMLNKVLYIYVIEKSPRKEN
jgi:hypothetical protein